MAAMRIGLDGEGGNTDMAEVMSTSDIYKSKNIYFTLDIDPQVAQPLSRQSRFLPPRRLLFINYSSFFPDT